MQKKNSSKLDFGIASVSRETGIPKDLLRMWERRYGFPRPSRDQNDDRIYSSEQVEKLHLIKVLMDKGLRPGKLIHLEIEDLKNALISAQDPRQDELVPKQFSRNVLEVLKKGKPQDLSQIFNAELDKRGPLDFVLEFMSGCNHVVGESWRKGEVSVHEEHLYTEMLTKTLRRELGKQKKATEGPDVLLTTLTGEQHSLGILMVETILTQKKCNVINLGPQTPPAEILQAVNKYKIDVVGLSFSQSFDRSRAEEALLELRLALPKKVEIWAGGAALNNSKLQQAGILIFTDLRKCLDAVDEFRSKRRQ